MGINDIGNAALLTPESMLDETEDIQQLTKDALQRCQWNLLESEETCDSTMEELRRQRYQIDRVQMEAEDMSEIKLKKTKKLLRNLGRWRGNWLGGHRRAAKKEATKIVYSADRERQKKAIGKPSRLEEKNTKKMAQGLEDSLDKLSIGSDDDSFGYEDEGEDDVVDRRSQEEEQTEEEEDVLTRLNRIEEEDDGINDALDEMLMAVQRLKEKTAGMGEEIGTMNEKLSKTEDAVDKSNMKQAYVNDWIRRLR